LIAVLLHNLQPTKLKQGSERLLTIQQVLGVSTALG